MKIDYSSIICKAELLYSEERVYHAIIIKKDFIPGSGDYEDSDDICDDRICDCYLVMYEDLTKPDNYISGVYNLTLEEARSYIEQTAGFQKWID